MMKEQILIKMLFFFYKAVIFRVFGKPVLGIGAGENRFFVFTAEVFSQSQHELTGNSLSLQGFIYEGMVYLNGIFVYIRKSNFCQHLLAGSIV